LFYFAFVHSYLLYGVKICGNATANHLSKLSTDRLIAMYLYMYYADLWCTF